MRLTELTCDGFRSLTDIHFTPGAALNVIRGDNAQGKTTLLEAILYLATSKSHRTNVEQELVRRGDEGFRITGVVDREDRTITLEAAWWRRAKRFRINGVAVTKLSEILGRVNIVFFAPEDVDIVRGTASERRHFLDMELSQLNPPYLSALQHYRDVLRQRNELLKGDKPDVDLLAVLDEQAASHGHRIIRARAEFVEALSGYTTEAYGAIAGGEALGLAYDPDVSPRADLAEVLGEARDTDLRRGTTTRGPHRDDMTFVIGREPARSFGSQGQQRTASLALKFAEVSLVKDRTGGYPILMLDDVLSELDRDRSAALFAAIPEGVQCLLTTTEREHQDALFGPEAAYFTIKGGRLAEG